MKDKHSQKNTKIAASQDLCLFDKDSSSILLFIHECTDTNEPDADEQARQHLEQHLEAAYIAGSESRESLPAVMTHAYKEVKTRSGQTLKRLLLDPNTTLDLLNDIKQTYKTRAMHASSEMEKSCARILYYTVIANALVFHQKRISSFSYHTLKRNLTKLINKPWLDSDTRHLLMQACRVCENRGAAP